MILTDEQKDNLFFPIRNGLIPETYRWTENIVPYAMSPNHTEKQQNDIKKAMKKIESISCIRFVPRTNQKDYIQFTVSDCNIQFYLTF